MLVSYVIDYVKIIFNKTLKYYVMIFIVTQNASMIFIINNLVKIAIAYVIIIFNKTLKYYAKFAPQNALMIYIIHKNADNVVVFDF